MTSEAHLGAKVRQLRELQQLTVADLAGRCGCEADLIEHLENGAMAPSLAPLMQLARALGVRLGTLLDDHEQASPVIVRAGQAEAVVRFSGGRRSQVSTVACIALGAGKADRHMEPFLVEVSPLNGRKIELSSHEGEEFLYVLEGEIELCYGTACHQLTAGDSLYYDSIVPHHLHALGGDARILAVIYTPL